MSSYKDNIFNLLKKFDHEREQHIHGWNDANQKQFYQKYLDPIVPDTVKYINMVDDFLDLLVRSKNEIDSLVGSLRLFYSGTPHERGDRAGETYALKDNVKIISTDFNDNSR